MRNRTERRKRPNIVKIRLFDEEKAVLDTKAAAAGMTVAELLRDKIEQVRIVNRADWQQRTLQLTRIGTNLNQLAAWAWSNKSNADSLEVVVALLRLERAIRGEYGLNRESVQP